MQLRAVVAVLVAQFGMACDAEVLVEREEEGEGAGAPGGVTTGEGGESPDIAVGEGAPEPSCNVQDTTPITALECGLQLTPDPVLELQAFAFQLVGTWFCHDPAFDFSTGPSMGVVFHPGGRYQVLVGDQSTVNDDVTCSPEGGLSGSWYVEAADPGSPGPFRLVVESDTGVWSAHYPQLGNGGTALKVRASDAPLLRL